MTAKPRRSLPDGMTAVEDVGAKTKRRPPAKGDGAAQTSRAILDRFRQRTVPEWPDQPQGLDDLLDKLEGR